MGLRDGTVPMISSQGEKERGSEGGRAIERERERERAREREREEEGEKERGG